MTVPSNSRLLYTVAVPRCMAAGRPQDQVLVLRPPLPSKNFLSILVIFHSRVASISSRKIRALHVLSLLSRTVSLAVQTSPCHTGLKRAKRDQRQVVHLQSDILPTTYTLGDSPLSSFRTPILINAFLFHRITCRLASCSSIWFLAAALHLHSVVVRTS